MIPCVASEYVPESWFHPVGILKVTGKLLPRLPDVSGSLFLTFTIDRNLFSGPESAFDHSRPKLRKILFKLRKGYRWNEKVYRIDAPYCVKVEFHQDGWAHFHVVFLTRRFLPGGLLNDLWELGRTNVKRISNKDFHYLLKYVTKGGEIPEWVREKKRLRIFQSSRGFYAVKHERPQGNGEPVRKRASKGETIGRRIERWKRTALLRDQFDRFRQVILGEPYSEVLGKQILTLAREGRYLGNGKIQLNNTGDYLQLEELS
ncbi:MAG: rolling circle replication-associated protein [Puniceicoccales bacterium]